MDKERKPSVYVTWLMPFIVVLSLAVVLLASRAPGKPPLETPQDKAPPEVPTASDSLYIEDIGPPHDTSAQGFPASTCRGCHAVQYDDWEGSPHAHATGAAGYQAALRHIANTAGYAELRRCVACHAPQGPHFDGVGNDGSIAPESQTSEGITCSACHKKEPPVGLFLIASLERGSGGPKPPQRSPEFCAQCHNQLEPLVRMLNITSYPDEVAAGNPFEEWRSSRFSQPGQDYNACIDCHGRTGTGTLHRWPGEKTQLIRSAYTIDLLRTQGTETGRRFGISITNTGTGHMLPTGDPGHVLTLEAWVMDENNTMLGSSIIRFSHIKSLADGGFVADDNRLSPGSEAQCWITIDDPENTMAGRADLVLKYMVKYGYDPAADAALKAMGVEPQVLPVDENTLTIPPLSL